MKWVVKFGEYYYQSNYGTNGNIMNGYANEEVELTKDIQNASWFNNKQKAVNIANRLGGQVFALNNVLSKD